MKYLLPMLFIFGCSINMDVRFPKPNEDSCKTDCEKYSYYTSMSIFTASDGDGPCEATGRAEILWKDNKNSYCICMDDCMGDDYDWEEECKREGWTLPTEQYEEFMTKPMTKPLPDIEASTIICQGCPGGTCVRTSMGGGAIQVCKGSCDECDMIIPSKDE